MGPIVTCNDGAPQSYVGGRGWAKNYLESK